MHEYIMCALRLFSVNLKIFFKLFKSGYTVWAKTKKYKT